MKYRAQVIQGRKVVARTRFSPASNFSVGQRVAAAHTNVAREPSIVKLNDGVLSIESNDPLNVEVTREDGTLVLTLNRSRLLLNPRSVRQIVFKAPEAQDTFRNHTGIPGTAVETRNRPPVAMPDRATVESGRSVEIPVLANDSDPDGDVIHVHSHTHTTASAHGGSVARKGPNRPNVLVYTPRSGFVGTDQFQYTISDGRGGTATGTVEIVVTAPREHWTLVAGQRLLPGQEVRSADNQYRFVLQTDGNLVLYGPRGRALWSTRTAGRAVTSAVMQSDGNFVLYNNSRAVWHARTAGHPGARLVVLNTGNVVSRAPGNGILWQAR